MAGGTLVEEQDRLVLEDNDDELLKQAEDRPVGELVLAGTAFGEYMFSSSGRTNSLGFSSPMALGACGRCLWGVRFRRDGVGFRLRWAWCWCWRTRMGVCPWRFATTICVVASLANIGICFVLGSAHVLIADSIVLSIAFSLLNLMFSLFPNKV